MSIGMDGTIIRESLATVGQYLSDTIPPVQAADSVVVLIDQPAEWMAAEITEWVAAQIQASGAGVPIADYLFHAVSKLHYLSHLQLISKQALDPYLDAIKLRLLESCPTEDRQSLLDSFDGLGVFEAARVSPAGLIHRQTRSGEQDPASAERLRDRRLLILEERLKAEVHKTESRGGVEQREDWVPHLIAARAASVQSDNEFRKLQENLKSLGIESETDKIFRKLSHSLPGWLIATTGPDAAESHNAAVEAMSQIINLAENPWDGFRRFQDMVQAAIEQFNSGSLARAATMFDLALSIISDGKLDPVPVAGIRSTAHESLDLNRLRECAKDVDRHPLLRTVLNFFEEFTVENLLESLRKEEKRDRRRLLLDLLEVRGDSARRIAFDQLKELIADTNLADDWHFARNLICILTRIPRPADVAPEKEIQLIEPLLNLSLPAPLVKEAIKFAGLTPCAVSEELLLSAAVKLEKLAAEAITSNRNYNQKISLLDRAIFALAHYGTPKACAKVVMHGTFPPEGLGDTIARLSYLSGQDLTSDRESVDFLIQFLKSKLPRKLFGLTIQKNEIPILHAIKALSSTSDPVVRQTFRNIAARFPETKFGQAAAAAHKDLASLDKMETAAERVLTGDLELFGLPDLLRQLNQLRATGTLTLKDAKGTPAGTLTLSAGCMQNCSTGRLTGTDAAYQLLERPVSGTFIFNGQKNSGTGERLDTDTLPSLDSILAEGLRRYDRLQRARALVPDFAVLRRKESGSTPPVADEDGALTALIWQKLETGASPEECEAACPADSYRIRTLLARWSEEGHLIIE